MTFPDEPLQNGDQPDLVRAKDVALIVASVKVLPPTADCPGWPVSSVVSME
jgi:hypothetical protein